MDTLRPKEFSDWVFWIGKISPLIALTSGLITLFGTLLIASTLGHLPKGLWLPFVSLCGVQPPERYLYLVGFTVTGICIFLSAIFARWYLFPAVETDLQIYAHISFYSALLAGCGLIVQAVVPLQSDILNVIDGTAKLQAQSVVHQTSALVLFLAG